MPDYKAIVDSIDAISEAQNIQTQGILKCIEANAIVTNIELKGIKKHLAEMNGTVATLKKITDERAKVVADFREHQKFGQWVHRNWWVVTLLFIASVTLIFVVLERFGLVGVLQAVKEVKDVL